MLPQIFKNENLFDTQIEKVSRELNIPFELIKAIITIESAFNPKAYRYEAHRKDASYGLCQIMYQTAKGLGFKGKPEDLYDPYTNIFWSGTYLKYIINTYKDIDKTFASYNMGLPRLAKDTTKIIISIYGQPQPDWKFANQPYVSKGLAYFFYFKAIRNKNIQDSWQIYKLIKNKKYNDVAKQFSKSINLLPIIFATIPLIILLAFLKKK